MRKIKFRAWDKHEKRMIYSDQYDHSFSWIIDGKGIEVIEDDGTDWNDLKDLKFMQYTGIKDMNGKEIYEGDLVQVLDYASWEGLYKVDWDEESLMYVLEDAYGDKEKMCEFEHYLVRGNIYENPELLEVN